MTILITEEARRFVEAQVKSGRYASEDEVVEDALRRMRADEAPPAPSPDDPLWGMFRDEPELIDQIVGEAMRDREALPLRAEGR